MKPLHIALLGVGAVVVFVAVRQLGAPPAAPPTTVNPYGGIAPGGTAGGQSDFQAGANAFAAFFNAVAPVAQTLVKNA